MDGEETYPDKIQVEEEIFEKLYKRYYQRLFNFSMQFTKDENHSRDLVHEVFLKLWESRERIKNVAVEAMLFKMTRNLCLNHVKHLKIVQNKHIDLKETRRWEELYRIEFIKDMPYVLIEQELHEKFYSIIDNLPEKCSEVFRLSRIQGLKNKEIASQLDISVKAVEKHISRAIREFRQKLPGLIPIPILILVLSQVL